MSVKPVGPMTRRAGAANGRRRMRVWTMTPIQIWLLTGLFWLATAVLALSIHAEMADSQQTFDTIGAHSERNLTYAQNLYFVLSALDADAADYLLVDAYPPPQLTKDRIRGDYQALRQSAVNLLVSADQNVTHSDRERYTVYRLQTKLHEFDSYVASAWLLTDQGHRADAVAAYEQATDIMQNEINGILEAAQEFAAINRQDLNAAYARGRTQAVRAHLPELEAGSGMAALASLALLMLFLVRRTKRVFSPPLIVAAGLTLALMIGANQVLTVSGDRLRTVQKAYGSVDALRQTRALVFDSKADESRYLADPARRRLYESTFLIRSRAVASFQPRPTLGTYDAALAEQVAILESGGAPAIEGQLGAALQSVRGDVEPAAARATLAAYAQFQKDDRVLRAYVARNDLPEAVRFSLGSRAGDSQGDLTVLDRDLARWIDINQAQGDADLGSGTAALSGWQWIPVAAWLLIASLAYLGIRRRLNEYPTFVAIIASRLSRAS
ncbi:MAG TPA: hypothetical protein VGO86_13485 [Candidatus Dormibacteraeota bacterium]